MTTRAAVAPTVEQRFRKTEGWGFNSRRAIVVVLALVVLCAAAPVGAEVSTADVLRGCYTSLDGLCLGPLPVLLWSDTSALFVQSADFSLNAVGETLCVLKADTLVAERAAKHARLTCGQWAAYLRDYVQRQGVASSWAGSVGLCYLYDPACGYLGR